MEKAALVPLLQSGWSLERIGRELGKHPSTVAYWLNKYGLRAVHRDRVAPKGGIARDCLAALVDEGLTIRGIAERLGVGTATVRHWLEKHGLRTASAVRRKRPHGPLPREVTRHCRSHGDTRFVLEGRGYYRCARCRMEQVSNRRREVKRILVAEAGGRCAVCGYDRHPAALQFHHVDPATKSFNLSLRGETRGIAELRAEARKCVVLCANCHAEVEAGIRSVPGHEKAVLRRPDRAPRGGFEPPRLD